METITHKYLNSFVDNLIMCHANSMDGRLSLHVDQLYPSDKEIIVACLIRLKRVDDWEWIYESGQSNHLTVLFSKMLFEGDRDSQFDLISKMAKYVVEYFEPTIQNLIDERIPFVEDNKNSDHGLIKIQNRNTGEVELYQLEGRN